MQNKSSSIDQQLRGTWLVATRLPVVPDI